MAEKAYEHLMTTQMPPHVQDFNRLCEIVADHFRVEPEHMITRTRGNIYKTPRHVVAAIFSNWATLAETAELLNFKNHQSVCYSRRRMQDLFNSGRFKKQINAVLKDVEKELPMMLP